jgi:fatty-acyl-CoA synthase
MTKMLTVGEMLGAQARLQPDRIGARDLERALTFREWNARACRLANALLGLGLAKGDRVAVFAYNRLEWAEIYAAVAKSGLIAVPVNFRLTAPEARFICVDSGVRAVIAEAALAPLADAFRDDLGIGDERYILIGGDVAPGWRSYEDLITSGAGGEPDVHVTPDDPWCLMYTSGTTGNPKGAIRSHRGMGMLALMTEVELA